MLRRIYGSRREDEDDYIKRSFKTYTLQQILLGSSNQGI
jgi:hypothetical protein